MYDNENNNFSQTENSETMFEQSSEQSDISYTHNPDSTYSTNIKKRN